MWLIPAYTVVIAAPLALQLGAVQTQGAFADIRRRASCRIVPVRRL